MSRWVILRQVVLAVDDAPAAVKEARDAFGLGDSFADPMLADLGIVDETLRVGAQAHLEFIAPLNSDVPLATWLTKGGGPGGYCFSIQVPDIDDRVAAAERLGVRTVVDLPVDGHRVVQLHPADMGLLVELDGVEDASRWFWDGIETEPPASPQVIDVLGVGVSSPDPEAQAERWSAVFDLPIERAGGVPQLALGDRVVRFLHGPRRTFVTVDLAAADGVEPFEVSMSGVVFRVR